MTLPPPTDEESKPCKDLAGRVQKTDEFAFAFGGPSDIYRGILKDRTGTHRKVAIKVLRITTNTEEEMAIIRRRLNRESRVWDGLKHVNVLPFLGIAYDLARTPALISPLCDRGHVIQYVLKNPSADRPPLVSQIAKGLEYLHSKNVIHGDLKSNNVLVDDDGRPLICDFGRSRILEQSGFTTPLVAGTARYMAPELFDMDDAGIEPTNSFVRVTKTSDVYSFAMVGVEILSGKAPFNHLKLDVNIVLAARKGLPKYECPPEQAGTWKVIESCAAIKPEARLTMVEVVRDLTPPGAT